MKTMQQPFDWETTMKTTADHAKAAVRMNERTVAALAETLDHLRHHGQHLGRLEEAMTRMETKRATPPSQPMISNSPKRTHHLFRLLPILTAYLAGVASVEFFWN